MHDNVNSEINKIPDQFLKNRVIVLVLKGLLDKVLYNIHYLILLTIFPSPLEFETTDSCPYVILFFLLLFVFVIFNRCQSSLTTITNWRLRVNVKQHVGFAWIDVYCCCYYYKNHLDLRFSIGWNSAVLLWSCHLSAFLQYHEEKTMFDIRRKM